MLLKYFPAIVLLQRHMSWWCSCICIALPGVAANGRFKGESEMAGVVLDMVSVLLAFSWLPAFAAIIVNGESYRCYRRIIWKNYNLICVAKIIA